MTSESQTATLSWTHDRLNIALLGIALFGLLAGLGLAIVRAIAEGALGTPTLNSPPAGQSSGFEALVALPATSGPS